MGAPDNDICSYSVVWGYGSTICSGIKVFYGFAVLTTVTRTTIFEIRKYKKHGGFYVRRDSRRSPEKLDRGR